MADLNQAETEVLRVQAPNGVTWTRVAGGRSGSADLLRELAVLGKGHVEREWDWWQDGRREQEHDRQWAVLGEWDNGARERAELAGSDSSIEAYLEDLDRRAEATRQRRVDLAAEQYDMERASRRLQMMRAEADAAFFAHVLEAPASPAQQEKAEHRLAEQRAAAQEMRGKLGDPEEVIDCYGYTPAERRSTNLSSHMTFWRHRALRELHSSKQGKRFKVLLAMRPPAPTDMCSECEAPAQWHEYALSLCLFRSAPAPGSTAEKIASLMPGWWQRCSACTSYQLEHQWGGQLALPDFNGEQWRTMLPPLLREIFAPAPVKPRQPVARPKPLAVISAGTVDDILACLTEAKDQFPDAQVRPGPRGTWELWPNS